MASIYLLEDGREIDVPCRYVEPVAPNKFDKVNQFPDQSRMTKL